MRLFKFKPLLKQTIRRGDKIIPFKKLDEQLENIGKSWEISGMRNNEALASEDEHEGRALNDVVRELKGKLIGEANYECFGDGFPLLVKFIDARQDFSVQVHPMDGIVRKQGRSRDKTEMWHIMDSDRNTYLRDGPKKEIMSEECKQMVENDTILDTIADYSAKEGGCFLLLAGHIRSIGTGCSLTEIQQTSDVTYRIYDLKHKDKNGNYRELHTAQVVECINYNVEKDYHIGCTSAKNRGVSLVHCPHLNTAVYDPNESMTLDYSGLDSFVILIGMEGRGKIIDNEGDETSLCTGETILTLATIRELKVEGTVKPLETYV